MGPADATPTIPLDAQKAVDASLPPAVNASAKGLWNRIVGYGKSHYYIVAIVVVVLLVIAGFVFRAMHKPNAARAEEEDVRSLPVPLARL